jgi:hypothetical protein
MFLVMYWPEYPDLIFCDIERFVCEPGHIDEEKTIRPRQAERKYTPSYYLGIARSQQAEEKIGKLPHEAEAARI